MAKTKIGRRFLRSGHSLDAISWQVFTSPCSGLAYGSFKLAVGNDFASIHTLDEQDIPESDVLYLLKLDKIIRSLEAFLSVLATQNVASNCEWLNPRGTGATGCVAFHHDAWSKHPMVFFEISACSSCVRINLFQVNAHTVKRMRSMMTNILSELIKHRTAMSDWIDMLRPVETVSLESVNIDQDNSNKVA